MLAFGHVGFLLLQALDRTGYLSWQIALQVHEIKRIRRSIV